MILYMNCYMTGEGYTLKRTVFPELRPLEVIRRREMPETESKIFTGSAAPYLFLGTVEGRRFGCVREIETPMRDENGRRCFIHVALEAEDAEVCLVDAILQFALRHRSRFVMLCNRMTVEQSGDYQLEPEVFRTLAAEASHDAGSAPSGLLIPQTLAENFFDSAGKACDRAAFMVPSSFEKWKNQDASMEMFLYCSTPSMGFMLSQIDPNTGEKLRADKEANDRIMPWAQSVLTQSGASLALFEQNGKVCLVVRDIQSVSTDQYGRRKKMSLVVQAPGEQALAVRQMAAWALVDFVTFSAQFTDCVKVYDGSRGYEVQGEKLMRLMDQIYRRIRLPEENPQRELWRRVTAPMAGCRFACLVCEASLGYFCQSCNISVSEKDIGLLLSADDWQEIRKRPAGIVFEPELYAAPGEVVKETPLPMEPEDGGDREVSIKAVTAPRIKEPTPEPQSAPKVEHEKNDSSEDERIDLLKLRGFWFVIGALGLAFMGGIAIWLYLRN